MRVETIILLLSVFVFVGSILTWFRFNRKHDELSDLMSNQIERNEEIHIALAMGLYARFKKEEQRVTTSTYLSEQSPESFESFVAAIFEQTYGGDLYIPETGEFGVTIEDQRDDGCYFIQAKCTCKDIDYHDVALLHSTMNKWGAAGGYIVTTAGFNKSASKYAEGLNIELINGYELVTLWLETFQEQEEDITEINSVPT